MEYQFESTEEMKSMPSNFWYNRAVTNKQNALLSPELIGGVGAALIFDKIIFTVLVVLVFWAIDYSIRFVYYGKRDKMMRVIGQEGKAITEMAWEGNKYLGTVEVNGERFDVKIDKESVPVAAGEPIQVIGLDGMKYVITKK